MLTPNAGPQPRLKTGAQRALEGVGCAAAFGLVTACLHWSSCTAAMLLDLCRMLKDRHDLHHTTLGIVPQPIRDALFQMRRSDDGPDGGPFCSGSAAGLRLCDGLGRHVVPRAFLEPGRDEQT